VLLVIHSQHHWVDWSPVLRRLIGNRVDNVLRPATFDLQQCQFDGLVLCGL